MGNRCSDHRMAVARATRVDWMTLALGALLAIALAAASAGVRAATYKWVDEKGVVHYSDKEPPGGFSRGAVEITKQGVPVKKLDAPLSPEQRKANEAEAQRVRESAKLHEEIARRDRALLQSYTTERDIDLARKRGLGTIEAIIASAQAYMTQLNLRKEDVAKKKATYGDKPVPPALEREATTVDSELAKQADLIAQKKKEARQVEAKYDADKARWRELAANRDATAAASNPSPVAAPTYGDAGPKGK
jgi:uncharacterized protein DUF4124